MKKYLITSIIYLCAFYVYSIYYYLNNGHLPYPFFYDANDSFMDFYNINFAAVSGLAYTEKHVFYSPLLLLLGEFITPGSCKYLDAAVLMRDCALHGYLFFMIPILLLIIIFLKKILGSLEGAGWWVALYALSFPMLFGFERGNYIFLAMLLVAIYINYIKFRFSDLLLPIIITSKFYLLILLAPNIFAAKFGKFILMVTATLLFNITFAYIYNDPGWVSIPSFLISFSGGSSNWFESMYIPTSTQSFILFFRTMEVSLFQIILLKLFLLIKSIIFIRYIYYASKADFTATNSMVRFLAVSILLVQVVTPAAGYYSLILLYPFYCYLLRMNCLSHSEMILIISTILPYPFTYKDLYSCYAMIMRITPYPDSAITLGAQSIVVPVVLVILFFKMTERNRRE